MSEPQQVQTQQEGFSRFHESIFITALFLGLILVIHVIKLMGWVETTSWGVYPREVWGMQGILLGPLVHGSVKHLLSNATPLLVTLFILHYFYRKVAMRSLLMIWVFTGTVVWLLANSAWHIGASGVVYGLVSFIFWTGVFRKNKKSVVLAMIMLILYSGMFEGILPNEPGISWESHLYGSIVGIFTAWWFKSEQEDDEIEQAIVFEKTDKQQFLAPDTFDKTLAQRRQEEEEERLRLALLAQNQNPFYNTLKGNDEMQ
jgi:membrane associated rhomboid family serine protease